jgi:DNA-binding CsgD family transcriptional regulator
MQNTYEYRASKRFCLEAAGDVRNICEPLFQSFNIHGFTFQRMYENGDRIYLSSSEKWIENFYQNNYFLASGFKKFNHLKKFTLWKNWPPEDKVFHKLMADANLNFNYGNGIVINIQHPEYIDAFTLRGFPGADKVNDLYTSEFSILEKWIEYFLIIANPFIQRAHEKKICVPESGVQFCFKKSVFTQNLSKDLYRGINTNLFLYEKGKEKRFLSQKQTECVCLLACGKTAKEIARIMNISPRTVEEHINIVKYKLDSYTRSDIWEKIFKENWNLEILMRYIREEKVIHENIS